MVVASVIVAFRTWRCDSASRALVSLAAGLALTALVGCSFERSPLVAGEHAPHVAPPSSSSGGGSGSGAQAGDPGSQAVGAAGSSAPPDTRPPADSGGAGTPGPIVTPEDAGGGMLDVEPDAGADSGTTDPDPPDSGCGERPACVCAHERLETPDDPCAAPDCPIDDCAPDDHCTLERFDSSVYYFCSNARSESSAEERCETIDDMHLVYIEDEDEDDFLDDTVDGKVWIGAELADGEWSWLDGTPFYDDEGGDPIDDAYVDWDDGAQEPNGVGIGAGEVACTILWSDTGAWADTNCTAQNGYVCEREL